MLVKQEEKLLITDNFDCRTNFLILIGECIDSKLTNKMPCL